MASLEQGLPNGVAYVDFSPCSLPMTPTLSLGTMISTAVVVDDDTVEMLLIVGEEVARIE